MCEGRRYVKWQHQILTLANIHTYIHVCIEKYNVHKDICMCLRTNYVDTSVCICMPCIICAVGYNLLTHSESDRRHCLLMSVVEWRHGSLLTGCKKKRGEGEGGSDCFIMIQKARGKLALNFCTKLDYNGVAFRFFIVFINESKSNGKNVLVHATKLHGWCRGIAPVIRNLGTGGTWMVSFTLRHPLNNRPGGL
jgi:hypothetical protein